MKFNLLLAVSLLLLLSFSCTPKKSLTSQLELTDSQPVIRMKSHTVNLKKGSLFLAVVGHQMPDKEALLQEYFGIVFPAAQKHLFAPLGQLPIDKVAAGDFKANEFVGLFSWPGMNNVQAFMGEIDPDQLTKLRMGIWSELKQHMVVVANATALTFHEDKTYEVKMVWGEKYSASSEISRAGGKVLFADSVAGYEDLGKNKSPDHLMIIEWANEAAAESFRKMKSSSFEKEEAFYTHFSFPESR